MKALKEHQDLKTMMAAISDLRADKEKIKRVGINCLNSKEPTPTIKDCYEKNKDELRDPY